MLATAAPTTHVLDPDLVADLSGANQDPARRMAHNAVSRVGADEAALDRSKVRALDNSFST